MCRLPCHINYLQASLGQVASGWLSAFPSCRSAFAAFLLAGSPALAQPSYPPFQRVGPDQYPFEDPVGILQDGRGYMWLADNNNLYKYDGYLFERVPDVMGWRTSGIAGGRREYICVYSGQENPMLYTMVGKSRHQVSLIPGDGHERGLLKSVHEDVCGRFWVGTQTGLVFVISPGIDTTAFPETDEAYRKLRGNPVTAIMEDSAGHVWIAGGTHVVQVDTLHMAGIHYDVRDVWGRAHPPDSIAAMADCAAGGLWLLTNDGELAWCDPLKRIWTPKGQLPIPFRVRSMFEDRFGDVWIVTKYLGIYRWNREDQCWTSYLQGALKNHGDPAAIINGACLDREGNIWVVSTTHGVLLYVRQGLLFHSLKPGAGPPSGRNTSIVNAVCKDRSGTLWIGTAADGLGYLLPGAAQCRFLRYEPSNNRSLSSDYIVCIYERRSGELWVGTLKGINVLDRRSRTFRRLSFRDGDPEGPGSDIVLAIFEDRRGVLWIGHDAGIDRFDDERRHFVSVHRWPQATRGGTGSVTAFLEDSLGQFWVGTRGRGLFLLDRESGYLTSLPIPWRSIHSICEDPTGMLWMGANDGLVRMDPVSKDTVLHEINIGISSGLRVTADDSRRSESLTVFAILVDHDGMIWIAPSSGGIVRFDPRTRSYDFHGEERGVVVTQGRRNALLRDEDGTIYCGGVGGLTWFQPKQVMQHGYVPSAVIVDVRVFQRPLPLPYGGLRRLDLDHWQHTVTIAFSMLDFVAPEHCRFEYLLAPAETAWTDLGNQNSLTLVNLDPMEHVLNIRGANSSGIWDREGIVLTIAIQPPFWASWWFRAAGMVLGTLLLYGLFRYRVAQIHAQERLRSRIASDLHDDIGSELSAIALDSELVACRLPKDDPHRDRFVALAGAVRAEAEKLRDTVWILNPDQDRIQDLTSRMQDMARRLLPGIQITFQCGNAIKDLSLDMQFKRHIHLMYKEILSNIATHAQATAVSITIELRDAFLHLCVADNGVGFDTSAQAQGHGLKSLRSRAERIGGTLTIESREGGGTVVSCEARIRRLRD